MKVRMIGIVCLLATVCSAMVCMAEEPAINPARITTPQIVVYGTNSASTFAGAVTVAGTFTASGNQIITGTVTVTGVATFTARPALNAALIANGTNVLLTTTGPTSHQAAPKWIPISHNGTNGVIPFYTP